MESKVAIIGVVDYLVMGSSLVAAAVIGIKFRVKRAEAGSCVEFLAAGRNMSRLPVVFSIVATMVSSIAMLGNPAEVYRFGFNLMWQTLMIGAGMAVVAYAFLPVYFQCEVATANQYLELRYGKTLRYVSSALFLLQMIFFMVTSLYAPVLAVGAVTNLSTEISILVVGLVCTFYCTMGGLKAVLWTDVMQTGLMVTCVIITFSYGVWEAGGLTSVFRTVLNGRRFEIFNLELDLTTRYTIWNASSRGFLSGLFYYGTSQIEMQRFLSLGCKEKARSSCLWSIMPVVILRLSFQMLGLVLYAIFYTCDPVLDSENTGVTKYDQLLPWYVVSRLVGVPGLTGLCLAGLFSGSLSTLSSALNSVCTVVVVDVVAPLSSHDLSDTTLLRLAKALSASLGVLCVGLTFGLTKIDSIFAVAATLVSIIEGPLLVVFVVGMFTRKVDQRCAVAGLLAGSALTGWVGLSVAFGGHRSPTLPLDTSGCSTHYNYSMPLPNAALADMHSEETFAVSQISYLWITAIGFFSTLVFICICNLITGCKDVIPADSKCLSPVYKFWTRQLPEKMEMAAMKTGKTAQHNKNESHLRVLIPVGAVNHESKLSNGEY